jgi:hypothetical protein
MVSFRMVHMVKFHMVRFHMVSFHMVGPSWEAREAVEQAAVHLEGAVSEHACLNPALIMSPITRVLNEAYIFRWKN